MNTSQQPLSEVPALNFPEISRVLKTHGVSLLSVASEGQCHCDLCRGEWSTVRPLDNPFDHTSTDCRQCGGSSITA